MTSDLQTRAKEVVMPTSQLLDLLCIMFPQKPRRNLNSRLDLLRKANANATTTTRKL